MQEVLVVKELESIKALTHQRRIDILNIFEEKSLSAKQISILLDEPHAKVNYHVKTLYKHGILSLVEEKIKSGIIEKYYYPSNKNIKIDRQIINSDDILEDTICLTKEELEEIKEIVKSKVEEIINKRENEVLSNEYDLSMIANIKVEV
ncbi:MAG: helix-turn-helix domain-containing protein [Peptostreptococcaceae bacterium]